MGIKLFHGSDKIIINPQYGLGKSYNDYGLGFYCTEDINMAKEWGVGFERDGYANCYEFDNSDIKVLNLNGEKFCLMHWLAILLDNRTFDMPSVLASEARTYIKDKFWWIIQNMML